MVILSVSEPRPKRHRISNGLFLPIFHLPFFVPFCFSITVCKAWWLQWLWEALQKVILQAHLFHLDISQGLAKWQMLMHPHVQPWRGWAAFSEESKAKPCPGPHATRHCQRGMAILWAEKLLCQQARLPTDQLTHALILPTALSVSSCSHA